MRGVQGCFVMLVRYGLSNGEKGDGGEVIYSYVQLV